MLIRPKRRDVLRFGAAAALLAAPTIAQGTRHANRQHPADFP
jgi:hypothetical protein